MSRQPRASRAHRLAAGNAFLSHIRAVDGIFHVMRAFDDPDVIHVEDRVDPIDDIEIITNELRLKARGRVAAAAPAGRG